MLRNLHVRNLALIREIDVDFTEGLNILTGETGSGKSIIVDAIGLALGGRISRELVSGGTALTELTFEVSRPETLTELRGLDVEPEDGQILIARKMQDGRSTIRVNGETRPAAEVRRIASLLLDIHGQSEHQKLLREDVQLSLLDAYGGTEIAAAKDRVRGCYGVWHRLKKTIGAETMTEEERARRISFLTFETDEIRNARLQEGEDEALEKAYRKLANARRIAEAVTAVHEATGYDEPEAAGERIGEALKTLEGVAQYDEALAGAADQLSSIDSLLNDFNRSLADYADGLEDGGTSLEETEERLNTVNRLKSKYGRTVTAVLDALKENEEELERLNAYEERQAEQRRELAAAEKELAAASAALTSVRRKWAVPFAQEASRQFADLNFARSDFAVEFREPGAYTENGQDTVDFCISTNPGAPRRPLRSVVSGGELSRLMLGIRTMFADTDATDTIIFDEVDTGISGRTAQKVAEKLACVARAHQVLCITHLPQIAAMADTHFCITKEVSDTAAITRIEPLGEDASVSELARLIGGAEITENTLNSAREMIQMSREFRRLYAK